MYRLMQMSKTTIPIAATQTHMFTRKRNRVEFIVDFPKGDVAEIISSIQVMFLLFYYNYNYILKYMLIGTSKRLECS